MSSEYSNTNTIKKRPLYIYVNLPGTNALFSLHYFASSDKII